MDHEILAGVAAAYRDWTPHLMATLVVAHFVSAMASMVLAILTLCFWPRRGQWAGAMLALLFLFLGVDHLREVAGVWIPLADVRASLAVIVASLKVSALIGILLMLDRRP